MSQGMRGEVGSVKVPLRYYLPVARVDQGCAILDIKRRLYTLPVPGVANRMFSFLRQRHETCCNCAYEIPPQLDIDNCWRNADDLTTMSKLGTYIYNLYFLFLFSLFVLKLPLMLAGCSPEWNVLCCVYSNLLYLRISVKQIGNQHASDVIHTIVWD